MINQRMVKRSYFQIDSPLHSSQSRKETILCWGNGLQNVPLSKSRVFHGGVTSVPLCIRAANWIDHSVANMLPMITHSTTRSDISYLLRQGSCRDI
jgi:hypothetical protein